VRSNPLSYNTEVGVVFAILDTNFDTSKILSVARGFARAAWHVLVRDKTDVLILEFGARQASDMRQLLRVVHPDIAIVTPLAPSYSEDHESLATLRAEMAELVDFMSARGATLAVCVDDPVLAELAHAPLTHRFGKHYPITRELVGDSSLYALAASLVVAHQLGMSDELIRNFLSDGGDKDPRTTETGNQNVGAGL
jgi:UDP-N-acetylmuramyl pentapeptide synthase